MSLYNMMCGMNPAAHVLLAAIDLNPTLVPRFRDVWIKRDLSEITVYTRTGGANREEYTSENAALRGHPGYLRDADDPQDTTFANFTFTVNEDIKLAMRASLEESSNGDHERIQHILATISETPREKMSKAMAVAMMKSS